MNLRLQLLAKCISAIAVIRFTSDEYERLLHSESSIPTSDATSVGQHASEKLDNLAALMGFSNSAGPQYKDKILETLLAPCNLPMENVTPSPRANFATSRINYGLWRLLAPSPLITRIALIPPIVVVH